MFLDTPGIHRPKTKLSEYMVRQVNSSVADVDLIVFVTEADRPLNEAEKALIATFRGAPAVAVINKIDLLQNPEQMLAKMAELGAAYPFEEIVPISVLKDDGVDTLTTLLLGYAGEGPHFFDDDAMTDQPERVIVAEIIREKILRNMRQEIPHGTAVTIESMKDRKGGGLIDIDAVIYCERESHKGMLIGKKGEMLKRIATQAREDAEGFLGAKINLRCWVKVKEDWRNREGLIRNFGYVEE